MFDIITEAYLGPVLGWVDLGEDPRAPEATSGGGITITRGKADAGSRTEYGRANLVIANTDGRYSPRNPNSPYYGILGRNTPIRSGVRLLQDSYARTVVDSWGTADTGQTWDEYVDALSFYDVSAGWATQAHDASNELRAARLNMPLVDAEQVTDIKVPAAVTGAAVVTGHIHRQQVSGEYYWCRLEFNAGSSATTLKISVESGGMTQLAELANVPGLTYTAGQPLRIRSGVVGARLAVKAWNPTGPEPADWMLTATDTTIRGAGTPGLQTWLVAGNSNVKPFAISHSNHQVLDRRMCMEVSSWPQRWTSDGSDVWTPIQAAGIMRRLGQGARPTRSALTRYLPGTDPIAWWPLEDGADSTQAASGLLGGTPMVVRSGIMDFVDDAPPGASGSAHPSPSASNALIGTVAGASASSWQISAWTKGVLVANPATVGPTPYYIPWEVRTSTGQILRLVFQRDQDIALGVAQYPDEAATAETNLVSLADPPPRSNPAISGVWVHVQFAVQQSGANTDAWLYVNGVLADSATWLGVTIGAPVRVNSIGAYVGTFGVISRDVAETYVSQIAIHDGAVLVDQYNAGLGYPGESAADRVERLCAADGVPVSVLRGETDSVAMGPQPAAPLLDLLRDCEDADQGILGEARERLALTYRTVGSLYNGTPVELDYSARHLSPPFEPVDDDQQVRNDITVSRRDGSSARAVQATGPLNVQDPADDPDGVGRYDAQYTVDVWQDAQLPDQAGWRRHLGTWDEARYARVRVNLASPVWTDDPALTAQVVALDGGDQMSIASLPAWLPPGPALVQVQGSTERLDAFERDITWSMVPGGPWTVGVVEDPILGRADTDGSELASSFVSGAATSLLVTVTDGPLWITTTSHSTHFPFDVLSGGVRLSVTGIAHTSVGGSNPGFELGNTTAWSVVSGTIAASTAQVKEGTYSGLLTANGSANPRATMSQSATITVPLLDYTISGWLYAPVALPSTATLTIQWYTAAAGFLGQDVILTTLTAGVWTYVEDTFTAPATAERAGRQFAMTGTPGAGVLLYGDDIQVSRSGRQTMTVTQTPVNGVARTIPSGTAVSLADPWRAAL